MYVVVFIVRLVFFFGMGIEFVLGVVLVWMLMKLLVCWILLKVEWLVIRFLMMGNGWVWNGLIVMMVLLVKLCMYVW